jgi:ABC-type siderophore export system fused ATPase/permease subunit
VYDGLPSRRGGQTGEVATNVPDQFKLSIPTVDGSPNDLALNIGDVLYILGANGTGKSSLVSLLFNQQRANAKRISAHRQT